MSVFLKYGRFWFYVHFYKEMYMESMMEELGSVLKVNRAVEDDFDALELGYRDHRVSDNGILVFQRCVKEFPCVFKW